MMSLDCPLAIRHKKGKYTLMEIGGVLEFIDRDRGSFGALDCISRSFMYFLFIWLMMYLFLWVVYIKGRYFLLCFMFLLLILVSHVIHWLLIYIMRLFMIYVFYFLFL